MAPESPKEGANFGYMDNYSNWGHSSRFVERA